MSYFPVRTGGNQAMITVLIRLTLLLLSATINCVHAGAVMQPDTSIILTRIAFGSCSLQSVPQPIFRQVVARDPDLYISLGDAIYGDYDIETKTAYEVTAESLHREWQVLADNSDWQYLVENVPVMATWDNHDYGHHSAGAEFPLKDESAEIFLDFFAEPSNSPRRRRPGIYDATFFGPKGRRVQIILLDTRSFKSQPLLAERPGGAGGSLGKYAPNRDPAATLLGTAQWAWLAHQLREPAELRLIISSGQIIADQKGMDEWGNYPLERRKLFDLLDDTGAGNTLLLSGNVHFSEVSRTDEGPKPLVEFTSSGLTHVNEDYSRVSNPYRVAGPSVDVSFGLIEINWHGNEPPSLTLSAVGVDGRRAFEYHFPEKSAH
jgi:alkaline phosphatase D